MSGTDDYDAYWEEYEQLYGKPDNSEDAPQQGVEHGPHSPEEVYDHYEPYEDNYGFGRVRASLKLSGVKIDEALEAGNITDTAYKKLARGIRKAQGDIDRKEMEMIDDEYYADYGHRYDDGDEDVEDPLAGDVDKWVHPDETQDGLS